jgi:hypothetical protein
MKAMKFIAVLAALSLSMSAMCQTNITDPKLLKQIEKDAKKETKRMEKEGWKCFIGSLPLERQLYNAYTYIYTMDEYGEPMYFIGAAESTAGNKDAGRMQASSLARMEIVHSIESEGTDLIENMVGNEQLGKEDAAALTTMISNGELYSSQKLGRTIVAVEAYRDLPNKNKEVHMRIVAKSSDIREIAKDGIRDEMKKRGKELSEKAWGKFNRK